MITPLVKDKVLEYLIQNAPDMTFGSSLEEFSASLQINAPQLDAILQDFDNRELMEYNGYIGGGFMLYLHAKAHDYYLSGGHVGEFEVMEKQFEKLKVELYALEKTLEKNKFDKIATILNGIVSFYAVVKDRIQ
jgi:hypothetical protein